VTRSLDIAFAIAGEMIDREYSYALHRALARALPWLTDEPLAGVHPIKGLTACAGGLIIGGRTRLVLRAPSARAEECSDLQGKVLELPAPIRIGRSSRRELLPYPVLYSRLVVTGAEDEGQFLADIEGAKAALEVDGESIVGRRSEVRVGERQFIGFSLMLHGLTPGDSLRVQELGLGQHRMLGCGVFVPHKSIAAVGT
jgi:CRISPR-associated protein Cas6